MAAVEMVLAVAVMGVEVEMVVGMTAAGLSRQRLHPLHVSQLVPRPTH